MKPCQVIGALKLVYTHESPTGVYFFLAELLDSFSVARGKELKKLSKKERLQFLHEHLPLVWYDCACTEEIYHSEKASQSQQNHTHAVKIKAGH